MPSILDYQSVLAVREHRNLARAAVTLGISQPALTARLRRLEDTLDVKLFDRGRHGARITAAGSAFAEMAERIVALAGEAEAAAQGAERGVGQSLRIGFTQISGRNCLLPLLIAFRKAYPLIRVQLRETTTAQLEALLAEDRLDAALLHPPVHRDGVSELHLQSCRILRVDLSGEANEVRPPVEYPRSEAPVLISEYNRKYPASHAMPPPAQADTAFGALMLSQAGFGPCVVAENSWAELRDPPPAVVTPLDMDLHTCLVWRSMDRRTSIRNLVALCREVFPCPAGPA